MTDRIIASSLSVSEGKYTIEMGSKGSLSAKRYGVPWRDLTGDKMVFCLATELDDARKKLCYMDAEITRLKHKSEQMNEQRITEKYSREAAEILLREAKAEIARMLKRGL